MFVVNSGVGYTGNNNPIFKFIPYYTAFSPRSIRNCSLWLDGNDPAGTGIQPAPGNLATWVDKSDSGTNATAGTSVYPQFTQSFLNNLGVVGLTNPADYFTVANNLNSSSLTYIFVMQPTAANTGGNCGLLSTDTAGLYGRSIALNNMVFQIEYYNGFAATSITTNSSTWYIVTVVFNGTSSITLSYNGIISTYSGSGTGTNSSGLTIGSYNSSSSYTTYNANFYLAEALVYTTALTQTEFQTVESYLAQKWGLTTSLPANHLNFTAPAGMPASTPAPVITIYISRFPPLYAFTSFTFTNATATLQTGPTLSQCLTAYAGTPWLSNYFTMTTTGYQLWTVPDTTTYTVMLAGAATNIPTNGYGYGIIVATTLSLTKGQQIQILVGQLGNYYPAQASCGGGGSFIASGLTPSTGVCLAAAGGGGGYQYVGTAGTTAQNGTSNTTGNTSGSGASGGSGGNGGSAATYYTQGGAGFTGNGGPSPQGNISVALSFVNGGTGGATSTGYYGGFGGGGGVWSSTGGAGAGGYSGGGGAYYSYGGGGGSFPAGTTLIGYNSGQGFVSVYATTYSVVPSGGSISLSAVSATGATIIFTAMTSALGYNYYITTSGSSIASPLYSAFTTSPGTISITVTIPPGATYYAALVGVNTVGSSSTLFSSGYVFPGAIATVTLSGLTSTGGTLTWTTSAAATGYNWYVGTGYGTGVVASGSTASLTTTFSYSLTNSYYYGWVQPTASSGAVLGVITYSPPVYYTAATGSLYAFTNFTFTNAGATLRYGPTLTQCQTAYAGTSWATGGTYLTMTTQGYQLWTVPTTGTYTVVCAGAAAATNPSAAYGYGAIIATTLSLSIGQQIQILVGHMGQASYNYQYAGGGGGTFFASGTTPAGGSCLVAGGGGGGWSSTGSGTNQNGSSTTSGNASSDGYAGGTNGYAGAVGSSWGHSGAGFIGNGLDSATSQPGTVATLSFINGGVGGYDPYGGYVGVFGGGSAMNYGYGCGGGGGGYSGGAGAGAGNGGSGGGGGSFPSGATLLGYNQGFGYVYVYAGTYSSVPTGGSVSLSSITLSGATLSISAATNTIVYAYYITTSGSSIASPVYSGTTTSTSVSISVALTPGTTYYAAMTPINTAGSGTTVYSSGYPIPGDTIVGFSSISTSSITLTWTTSTSAVSYAWSVSTAASGGTVLASGTSASLTSGAVSVSLSAGTNYYGRITPSSATITGQTYVTGATQTSGTVSFTYVGYIQAYTVPSGISSVTVTLTGGGGGGGGNGFGSAGAYVNGTMAVTAGTTYYIIAGGGGKGSNGGQQFYVPAFGGGGVPYTGGTYAGNGGGRSAIQATLGTDYVDAGGGGGSGYGNGGAGGALGGNGTGTAGGAGGTLTGGPSYQGGSSLYQGGGGGAGGYQGGGAGGSGGGGGGGGSSLTSNLTGVTVTTGGGGAGGSYYVNGGNGTVTIV